MVAIVALVISRNAHQKVSALTDPSFEMSESANRLNDDAYKLGFKD